MDTFVYMMILTILYYFVVPVTIILIVLIGILLTIWGISIKDVKRFVIGVTILVMLFIYNSQSDFIKSRKKVDKDWMIGKTLSQVQLRYSTVNEKQHKHEDEIIVNGEVYCYGVREIFAWSIYNGVEGEILYYIKKDHAGKIADVYCVEYGGDVPYSCYDYSERW